MSLSNKIQRNNSLANIQAMAKDSNLNLSNLNEKPLNYNVAQVANLSDNETYYYQGEAYIGISPFDDYFLFNLVQEKNGEDIPIDLTNTGDLYLSFLSNNSEVKIQNIKESNGIDPKHGQVLFKINKDQSKKILAFKDNNFYISSKLTTNGEESDESVLYTGKFFPFNEIPTNTLKRDYSNLKNNSETILNDLSLTVVEQNTISSKKDQEIITLKKYLKSLTESNKNLQQLLDSVKPKLSAKDADKLTKDQQVLIEKDREALNYSTNINNSLTEGNNIKDLEAQAKSFKTTNF